MQFLNILLCVVVVLTQISFYNAFLLAPSHRYRRSTSFQRMSSSEPNAAFASHVVITSAGASIAMAAAEADAAANGWDVTICVCDAGGVPIYVKRNAFAASYEIATGKAKSAALFAKETGLLEDAANVVDGRSRTALLSSPFLLMRGGVPLMVNGICCGAVGVSGVQADQDEQIARAAVAALRNSLPL
mmetsp:Transcript_37414/g.43557  ORF Transcript_37414/g.43557 Transcript_37414/m.43557 type:complete len:188 (-) Transcript_37414:500-1063(-)